jgi:hypothetical protein
MPTVEKLGSAVTAMSYMYTYLRLKKISAYTVRTSVRMFAWKANVHKCPYQTCCMFAVAARSVQVLKKS